MTINSRIIRTFLQWAPEATDVPLMNGLRVQILPSIDDLPRARKNQFAAFVAVEALLVVWDDEPTNIITRASAIEDELMELVWKTGEPGNGEDAAEKKKGPAVVAIEIDEESGQAKPENRPTNIMNSVLVALTLLLITVMLGAGFRQIAIEIMVDQGYARLAFLALTPIQIFFTLVSFSSRQEQKLGLTRSQVFRTSHSRMHSAMHWTDSTDDHEFPILLCYVTSPTYW